MRIHYPTTSTELVLAAVDEQLLYHSYTLAAAISMRILEAVLRIRVDLRTPNDPSSTPSDFLARDNLGFDRGPADYKLRTGAQEHSRFPRISPLNLHLCRTIVIFRSTDLVERLECGYCLARRTAVTRTQDVLQVESQFTEAFLSCYRGSAV